MMESPNVTNAPALEQNEFIQEVLNDFKVCCLSREASLLGRKEVLSGKAKFGIFGDGKEVPQVALARAFRHGDFRSGYYRDQTFMMAMGLCSIEDFFAQLYADPENDPFSAGRQMNAHFATPLMDKDGKWLAHKDLYNVTSDISPTAGQLPRALGVALASKTYRQCPSLHETGFSNYGNEISVVTIGDASTSEGPFWECVNAAAVMQVPLAVCVWDDGYGISVPKKYQTAMESISQALAGMETQSDEDTGISIYHGHGWNYAELVSLFQDGFDKMRETHRPALFHIQEITQPQGHSTSGSHERYKDKDRLTWEAENDCIKRMAEWLVEAKLATVEQLDAIREEAKVEVKEGAKRALEAFNAPIKAQRTECVALLEALAAESAHSEAILTLAKELSSAHELARRDNIKAVRNALRICRNEQSPAKTNIQNWLEGAMETGRAFYNTHLYSQTPNAAINVAEVAPVFSESSAQVPGYQVMNTFFDKILETHPEVVAFGEDVGNIGDVNQGFMNMQKKYGVERVFDTGIREWSIMGQGLGMSMRGLRPIAEIQYLDYLLYGLTPLADDVATLRYRCAGQQAAPLIVRTRGHRLEGVWHTGSPMGMIVSSLRGMYVCVPRDMVQAAGMYNTLLKGDDPGLVIECLNGYRLRETMPDNIGEYTVPLGKPEVLQQGSDVTLVTYGSCVRVAQEAMVQLAECGISVELIDVQTLLPFDINGMIADSLSKTNRLVVLDEDVPGGASAYILQQILEKQEGYFHLDSAPVTIAAAEHRSPYGSEGDYFAKPSAEDIFEKIYAMMSEVDGTRFPSL